MAKLCDVLDIWMSEHGERLKDVATLRSICKHLVRHHPATTLHQRHVNHYVAVCEQRKLAPATIMRNLGVLRRAINHYGRAGNKIPEIHWPKLKVTQRQRFLTDQEQFDLVMETSKAPMVHALVVLLLDTGMRLGEAQKLAWTDFNIPMTAVEIWRPKTETTTVLPVSLRLKDCLKVYWDVFFSVASGRTNEVRLVFEPYLWSNLVRICRGHIKDANNRAEVSRLPEHERHGKITLHTLRDTFATNMLRRGLPITDVQYLLGHTNINQTMKYAHVIPADAVERARALLDQ